MNDREIRLECLRLANAQIDLAGNQVYGPSKSAVELAEVYYAFVYGASGNTSQSNSPSHD